MPVPPTRAALAAVLLAAVLGGCHGAYFGVLNHRAPAPAQVERATFDARHRLVLDVHRPAPGPEAAPVVVFFHGGSWHRGSPRDYRFVGAALSANGVLVIVPDYRKAPEHRFPAFMDDAALAVAWTLAHARELGGDPGNVTLVGHSAGAHIAALLATDARHLARVGAHPRQLHGVVGLAGPYDFLPITHPQLLEVFGDEAQWPASQPVNFVDGDEPPFLLLHGANDDTVRPANSERLAALLRARGEPVELRVVPHRGHAALVNGYAWPQASPVLAETLRFVGRPVVATTPASGTAPN